MKAFLLVAIVSAYTGVANACVEPTTKVAKTTVSGAVAYFYDQIAKDANVLKSNPTFDVVDCHDYDGEFSSFDVKVSWSKKVGRDYQRCSVLVRAEPARAFVDDTPACE